MFRKFFRFWHTVRFLKPVQWYFRVIKLLPNTPIIKSNLPTVRSTTTSNNRTQWRNQSIFDDNSYVFLNSKKYFQPRTDWNSSNLPKLWLYNLHYFDDLNAINSLSRFSLHHRLLDTWIEENPVGLGVGWESYPISLRLVNWIFWSSRNNYLTTKHHKSLVIQARWLYANLEYHLLANHLWANAKALLFAGTFFQGPEAEKWRLKGQKILSAELVEQCLDDGGHFERSPMYHSIFLDDIIDILYLVNTNSNLFDPRWVFNLELAAHSMLSWLNLMSHPDNNISFFNDSTFGIAAPMLVLKTDFNRIVQYAPKFESMQLSSTLLANSGFCRLTNDFITCLCDVGSVGPSYVPGHAHAQALCFELSYLATRVIVNSGVSMYGCSSERIRQRSTSSHSTVVINDSNSSDVWSGFRVGRRSTVIDRRFVANHSLQILSASHNGYSHLPGSPIHKRIWSLNGQCLSILDEIYGDGEYDVSIYFHLSPNCQNLSLFDNVLAFDIHENSSPLEVKLSWDSDLSPALVSSTWHPGFNLSIDNHVLRLSTCATLPLSFEFILSFISAL